MKREQEREEQIVPSIEGEDDPEEAPMREPADFTTTFYAPSQSQPKRSLKRKRGEEGVQSKKKRKQKKIYISPYYEYLPNRGQMDPERYGLPPRPTYDPIVEAAHEKVLAGTDAPDYSQVIDKASDDEVSWVDSEEEIDSSDDEDDRGCYGKRPRSDTEELGYDTERLSTPEMDAIIEQHSQEFNSPAARAQRDAILAHWAEEDAQGLFFGRPFGRRAQTRQIEVAEIANESDESDKPEDLIDPVVSIQSGTA